MWMHNEMLQVEGKKMSKSLGNFFTVRDLLDQGVPGEVIRFVFLSTHYRKPMDWTEKKRIEAEATLRKWRALTAGVVASDVPDAILAAVADDLNTSGVLAEMHKLAGAGEAAGLLAAGQLIGLLTPDLAGWDATPDVSLDDLTAKFSDLRAIAMETKDFAALDAFKTALMEAGVEVKMSKEGVSLDAKPGVDLAMLEALT